MPLLDYEDEVNEVPQFTKREKNAPRRKTHWLLPVLILVTLGSFYYAITNL